MDFREKVRRLVGTLNKSELSRKAGLPETAIDAVVNKGREPLASNAVRLARVLDVSCDWLFDDEAGWPAPKAQRGMGGSDAALLDEVIRRKASARQSIDALAEEIHEVRGATVGIHSRSRQFFEWADSVRGLIIRARSLLAAMSTWSEFEIAYGRVQMSGRIKTADLKSISNVLRGELRLMRDPPRGEKGIDKTALDGIAETSKMVDQLVSDISAAQKKEAAGI